jgi:predicted  nucleic acid-binding Zn ribbon protein
MGLASYLLLVGIYNSATIAARDVNLRKYLANKLENDTTLLMNIAFSEKETEVEKNVKSLFTYSEQWQQDNRQLEMTQQQIKEVINDVISEVKKDISKKGNTTKS